MMENSIDLQPMLDVQPVAAAPVNRRKKWLMGALGVMLIAASATIGVVVGRSTSSSSEPALLTTVNNNVQEGMAYREMLPNNAREGMAYREVSEGLDLDIDYEDAEKTEIDMLKISKSGTEIIYGRTIDWKTRLYTKGLKVRYSATATDRATGIQGSSSNHKSGKGATEAAVTHCFQILAASGYLQAAELSPAVAAIAVPEVDADSSDDVEIEASELLKISKSGTTDVLGRQIKWKATMQLKGLKIRYKATATDKQSGISGSSSGHKSGKGAVEAATKKCFEKMIAAGVIPMPQAALEVSSGDVDAEFPFDNSEADIADEVEESDMLKISKSGTEVIYGRTIDWKTRLYTKGLKVRYSATATDRATGIQGSSSNYKSGKGATEAAVKQCFEKLAAAGLLQTPELVSAVGAIDVPALNEDTSDVVEAAIDDVESEDSDLLKISKSGTEVVYGRTIKWKSTMQLKGLKIRYKATATDTASGISGSSSGHKSGKGSVEAAVKDCFNKLIAAGIITP